jgi:TATA-binding protein-associated factor
MLLTIAVGGLGLNLTAADTVIFLEHDWNPQKDIQAMDRAHRLGQKRAVNVYRILVKGTLEESIMSLQRFKLDVAATVVNADNISMKTMDTGSLLDTLVASKELEGEEKTVTTKKTGLAAMLAELPDLDETAAQYHAEFDLDAFRKSVGIDKRKDH